MKPMKFKKARNNFEEESVWQEIIFIEYYAWREREVMECNDCRQKAKIKDISYICIKDGVLGEIFDEEWLCMCEDYDFVEFID